MELIPEWAPNIHPMLVHFPIAILSIAMLFDFIAFFLPDKQRWWSNKATAFLFGVGAATAIGVYFTGRAAANGVFLQAEAQSLLTAHAGWALWTLWFYGVYAVARILTTWKVRAEHRLKFHIGFFLLSFVGLFLLIQTGNRGAKMVFKYGVGVEAAEIENPVQHNHETDHNESEDSAAPTSFHSMSNGNWTWEIGKNAVTALQNNFHWLTGSPEALNAKAVPVNEGGYALSLSGENMNGFFAGQNDYQNIQVDYYLNISDFEGTIWLTTHVQDSENYDFVSISSEGTVKQGRMIDEEATIFETGTADVSTPVFVRVVGSGSHFRGYIDKEMVVHGHGDAPEAGGVGLKLEGSGKLHIQKIELTQLN